MIHSALAAWWRRWAGRTSERCPVRDELRKVVKVGQIRRPSESFAQWLQGFGWEGEQLHPEEAAAWLV
eukprot:11186791-Lingulodinium_polyedra.AAC.1